MHRGPRGREQGPRKNCDGISDMVLEEGRAASRDCPVEGTRGDAEGSQE